MLRKYPRKVGGPEELYKLRVSVRQVLHGPQYHTLQLESYCAGRGQVFSVMRSYAVPGITSCAGHGGNPTTFANTKCSFSAEHMLVSSSHTFFERPPFCCSDGATETS